MSQCRFLDFLAIGDGLIAAGLTAGLGASLVVNKVIASELWGVSPRDPATFVAVALVVLAAGTALVGSRRCGLHG